MKKSLRVCLALILLAVFVLSGGKLLMTLREYRAGEDTYESMEQYVVIPETTGPQKSPVPASAPEQQPQTPEINWPEVDFEALREINPDVVGWLYLEGTQINYPVLQGEDNDQYLYRLITGEHNSAGSLFLKAGLEKNFSGQNNPVYGHNMKNGSMFGELTGYKAQAFYEEHPIALLLTPEGNYQIKIFSAYVMEAGGDAWDTAFSESSLQEWLDGRMERSWIATDVIPTTDDRVITLSTCSYETDDSRFLVHGILVPG